MFCFVFREKTQKELQDARQRLDEKDRVEVALNADIIAGRSKATDLDRQLSDARATVEKYLRDYDTLLARTQKVTDDLEKQVLRNKDLMDGEIAAEKEMKYKVMEISRLKSDNGTLERSLEKEHRATLHYQQLLEESKTPLALAEAEIESLKKDIILAAKSELQVGENFSLEERLTHHYNYAFVYTINIISSLPLFFSLSFFLSIYLSISISPSRLTKSRTRSSVRKMCSSRPRLRLRRRPANRQMRS